MVKQKCADLTKAGVTQIIFGSPLGPDMTNSIRLLGKYVCIRAEHNTCPDTAETGDGALAEIFFSLLSLSNYPAGQSCK